MAAKKAAKVKASVTTIAGWTPPVDPKAFVSPVSYGVDSSGTVTTKPVTR